MKGRRADFTVNPIAKGVDVLGRKSLITPGPNLSARLMPVNQVRFNSFNVVQLFLNSAILSSSYGLPHYFIGGAINEVLTGKTAIHPAMRSSIYSLHTLGEDASKAVRNFIPNSITGVEYNYHNVIEPDWRNACWGTNYQRLYTAKEVFDPHRTLNCWHCVGYQGAELPARITAAPSSVSSTGPSVKSSSNPSGNLSVSNSPSGNPFVSNTPSPYPSIIPSTSPSSKQIKEKPFSKFFLKIDQEGIPITRRCQWLSSRPFKRKRRICAAKRFQIYSIENNLAPASRICFETCSPFCPVQIESAQFLFQNIVMDDGQIELQTRQCKWLATRDADKISNICSNKVEYSGYVLGQASEVCTELCASC